MSHDITIFQCSGVTGHCAIYHDDELKSAKVVKRHMEDCLEYWGYTDHNVTVSSDTSYGAPYRDDIESELDYFDYEWLSNHEDKADDSNLLLLDNEPSGPSGKAHYPQDGTAAVKKGGKDLADHSYGVKQYGDPTFAEERVLRGSIHEIGHNYDMHHGDGRRYDSDGKTYATPHGCEIDYELQEENRCGHSCSQSDKDVNDHWFAGCAENKL